MKSVDEILSMSLRDALKYIKGAYCWRTKFACKKTGECPFFTPVEGARWMNRGGIRGGTAGHGYTDDIHICAWYRFGKILEKMSGEELTKMKGEPGTPVYDDDDGGRKLEL